MKNYIILFILWLSACNSGDDIIFPDGGYNYPAQVANKDTMFYKYPIRDSLSRRDSMYESSSYLLYQAFDEPNLSIRPLKDVVFRLTYVPWMEPQIIITLSKSKIVIKSGVSQEAYAFDTSKLTAQEKKDYIFLINTFPVDTSKLKVERKHFFDSVFKQNPRLSEVEYLLQLKRRQIIPSVIPFKYSTRVIKISDKQYETLVNEINQSGFWTMPFKINCETLSTEAGGFTMEANTKDKYKVVSTYICPDNNTAFIKACEQIINAAGMKGIHLTYPKPEVKTISGQ